MQYGLSVQNERSGQSHKTEDSSPDLHKSGAKIFAIPDSLFDRPQRGTRNIRADVLTFALSACRT